MLNLKVTPKNGVTYDYVLVSVGRIPNSSSLGLDKCDVEIDDKNFIIVNEKLQTKASNILCYW